MLVVVIRSMLLIDWKKYINMMEEKRIISQNKGIKIEKKNWYCNTFMSEIKEIILEERSIFVAIIAIMERIIFRDESKLLRQGSEILLLSEEQDLSLREIVSR